MRIPDVELDKCIFCEICTEICPEVFVMNDAGYIEVKDLKDYPEKMVLEAVKICPADCISYKDS